jgi:putative tricarboxylic transport membrane protein
MRRAMTCWLALAVCVALLKFVGFIIAFGLLTWFIVAIMFRRPQRVALSLAVGGALGFYALFNGVLDLPLPAGLLF